jgi:hypothetical protein
MSSNVKKEPLCTSNVGISCSDGAKDINNTARVSFCKVIFIKSVYIQFL